MLRCAQITPEFSEGYIEYFKIDVRTASFKMSKSLCSSSIEFNVELSLLVLKTLQLVYAIKRRYLTDWYSASVTLPQYIPMRLYKWVSVIRRS